MPLALYAHPFSSYCQKVLIALYENDTPFEFRLLAPENAEAGAEFAELWPLQRMPVLLDDGQPVVESSIIVEHLMLQHPGPVRLLPTDAAEALEIRKLDRLFDCYVMTPMQAVVFDRLRPEDDKDPSGVDRARTLLQQAYAWLDGALAGRAWAAGETFSLADCAAAPALFYADWVHPIAADFETLRAYRTRLLARPSFARAIDEARPYRYFFPGGAPDRD